MIIYKYLFYSTYKWYEKSSESLPQLYAVGVVTTIQAFTIIMLMSLLKLIGLNLNEHESWLIFTLGVMAIFLNYFYYNKLNTYETISKEIEQLSQKKITRIKTILYSYLIAVAVIAIVLLNID